MGGSIGAWLHRAGRDVLLVDSDEEHVAAIRRDGLRIVGPVDSFTRQMAAATPAALERSTGDTIVGPGDPRFECVLLCVKAHHTHDAVRQLAPHVAEDGYVVSVQNGLNEREIADIVGAERTIGCFVNFGADVMAPGVVMRGNRGAVVVGELDGRRTERLAAVHGLLRLFEPDAIASDNIHGFLWGKLAYGAILFATALAEASIADVLDSEPHRPTLIELGREVMRVAEALGVSPEAFDGFDPAAFHPTAPDEKARESLDRLVAFNRMSAKTHSGVWRDLAVRKRKTEVDAQIAVIADLGSEKGVPTPVVRRLVDLIHGVEEGRRPQGWEALDALGGA